MFIYLTKDGARNQVNGLMPQNRKSCTIRIGVGGYVVVYAGTIITLTTHMSILTR